MEDWLTPFINYKIADRSFVSYIKREIHNDVQKEKFSDLQTGQIDMVVSELTSNLVKHAGNGELFYRIKGTSSEIGPVFEIISIDSGPGMADTARMIRDGVLTTSTLSEGLGAIHRLSGKVELFSMRSWGTVLYASVGHVAEKSVSKKMAVDVSAICVNKPRENVCGDGYRFVRTESGAMIFFGDGLGHGPYAKEAVDAAGELFLKAQERDPVDILRQMHEHIRLSRGLVGVIAVLNKNENQWRICGVGNIATRLYTGISHKTYLSYNGTVGLNMPNSMKASIYPCERNQHLIMCSDGINSRWDLSKYPAIFKYDNLLLASAIYKDSTRGNDDSSILIAKVNRT